MKVQKMDWYGALWAQHSSRATGTLKIPNSTWPFSLFWMLRTFKYMINGSSLVWLSSALQVEHWLFLCITNNVYSYTVVYYNWLCYNVYYLGRINVLWRKKLGYSNPSKILCIQFLINSYFYWIEKRKLFQ